MNVPRVAELFGMHLARRMKGECERTAGPLLHSVSLGVITLPDQAEVSVLMRVPGYSCSGGIDRLVQKELRHSAPADNAAIKTAVGESCLHHRLWPFFTDERKRTLIVPSASVEAGFRHSAPSPRKLAFNVNLNCNIFATFLY